DPERAGSFSPASSLPLSSRSQGETSCAGGQKSKVRDCKTVMEIRRKWRVPERGEYTLQDLVLNEHFVILVRRWNISRSLWPRISLNGQIISGAASTAKKKQNQSAQRLRCIKEATSMKLITVHIIPGDGNATNSGKIH